MDVISRRQAQVRGMSERDLQRLVADGSWTRLRRGWYLTRPPTDDSDRHRQLLDTFLVEFGATAVAGYVSAAVCHGLALHRADLSTVHLCRVGGGRSKRAPGVHLHAALRRHPPAQGVEHVATTVVQIASLDLEAGLVAADDALHRALLTREDLARAAAARRLATGAERVRQLALRADARHESAAETLAAMRLCEAGILVDPQFRVPDTGRWTRNGEGYRTDFRVRGTRVLIEFDGAGKYDEPGALWREKQREDRIRSLGWIVVRLVWSDLFHGRVAAKVGAALAMAC
ncbi:Transcriptional regulator, AbiEi antitoxin, Type IV TA system [Branchiibius hedensis]|uniref:Transcriptional regulator, AbiEi antitoxin, Type IV TA system n=1 Tax=Branchiibius hedensis TaxID=672460 RepID=A0A2Y8ZKQ3_9MICO|nr:Transcriptional regulator, AbiEi antitoxin, Type IV TA system [Branchiibius hedensis]SSA32980.1 Transcriptional regulator, AbiEi antitoxin, Type IV TA system [Branchiibius hedensis]